jgi:hypothetical protein
MAVALSIPQWSEPAFAGHRKEEELKNTII